MSDIATDDLFTRLGPRRELGLPTAAFDIIFSVRRLGSDHINLEEARALLLFVRWVLRTPRLVDSVILTTGWSFSSTARSL